MGGIQIQHARSGAAEAIAAIHNAAFAPFIGSVPSAYRSRPLTPEEVRSWLARENDVLFVACDTDRILGYAHVRRESESEVAFVGTDEHAGQSRIAVHPDHRRRGIGRALVTNAIRSAGRSTPVWIWAGAWSDNREATAFLSALGFESGRLTRPCPHTVDPLHTDDSVLATFDLAGPIPQVPPVPSLKVREAREGDIEPLRAVFGESRPGAFGPKPTSADIRGWLKGGWAETILVAEYEGQVVGSMEFRSWGVLGIAGVRPRFRRRGIGTVLLVRTLEVMKGRGLSHALADTGWFDEDAIRLYERLGFDMSRWLRSWQRQDS